MNDKLNIVFAKVVNILVVTNYSTYFSLADAYGLHMANSLKAATRKPFLLKKIKKKASNLLF